MNDIVCFEMMEMNHAGLTLKHKSANVFINFAQCAENFANEKALEINNCVATRDITKLTFTFYTNPKIKMVFKKNFLKALFSGKSAVRKFLDLQKAMNSFGYTSYDLS